MSTNDQYDGSWSNGRKHGNGKYKFANGDYYEGYFDKGLR